MNKNLCAKFSRFCNSQPICEVCSLYILSEELKIDCEELFQYLSEKYQLGVAKEDENE